MRIAQRAKPLLISLLLPLLGTALLALFTIGAVLLSANDRAILWAEGTPAQLQAMERRVLANPWFRHGRHLEASQAHPLPPECGTGAREFSFGSLGEFEAQAAREILELIASESGARPCLSNVFIINELPDGASQTWTQRIAATVLGASALPLALVLLAFVALSPRMQLAALASHSGGLAQAAAWAVATGVGASLMLALLEATAGTPTPDANAMTVATVGYPLAFTLVVAVPVIEEVAFRGWMLPLAERGIGALPAALASSALYAAASLPGDAWSAAGYLLLGAAYAALYLRTRSVPACIAANVMVSAGSFWMA